jgi:hypothetical protein
MVLKAAGVVVELEAPSGRRASFLALDPDVSSWGELAPGCPRRRRRGNPDAFQRRRLECAPDGTLQNPREDVDCAPDGTHGARQTVPYGPLSARQTDPSEEQSEDCSSEGDGAGTAEAAPPSPAEKERVAELARGYVERRKEQDRREAIAQALGGTDHA